MRYVMGVDIGTSSTKAVLFDINGQQVALSAQGYVLRSPEPGAAEQDPNDILQATLQTVATVIKDSGIDPKALIGISFSAAMHTLLLLDQANQPLTPLFTWADNRSGLFTEAIAAQSNQTRPTLYQRTSVPVHPMSPVVKLAWLKQVQPEVFSKAARVVSIKEYVLHHWCGEWVVDASIASATGLFNVKAGSWDEGALKLANIRREQLSKIVPTVYQLRLKERCAQQLGLAVSTSVIVGASDGVLSNLGVGAIAPGQAAITLGTSGAIRQVIDQPRTAEEAGLFCYVLDDMRWVMGGAVNNGGIVLQWVRDNLVPYWGRYSGPHALIPAAPARSTMEPSRSTYERLTKMAEAISPGADGLIFHPHILGERAPLWNAQARGNFFGLGRHHTQSHLVRAVMEGVLYNLFAVFKILETAGGEITTLRASGGFAHSTLWQQMLADIFEREVVIPTVIESAALGAAVLALVAVGEWSDLARVQDCVDLNHARAPIAQNVRRYQKMLPIYQALQTSFDQQYAALQAALREH